MTTDPAQRFADLPLPDYVEFEQEDGQVVVLDVRYLKTGKLPEGVQLRVWEDTE